MKNDNLILLIPEIAGKKIALIKDQDDETDMVDVFKIHTNGNTMEYLISITLNSFASGCRKENIDFMEMLFKVLEAYLKQDLHPIKKGKNIMNKKAKKSLNRNNDNLVFIIPEIAGKGIALIKDQNETDKVNAFEINTDGDITEYLISVKLNEFISGCLDGNMDFMKTLFKMLEVYLKTGYTFN
ncbi:MAG: hypothetical protein PHT21_02080 [Lachnospiraceae bacterium]|nr:hypothetical protein [Lachnospiraceae bacterium]